MLLKNPTNGKTIVGDVKALLGNGVRGTKDKQNLVKNKKSRALHYGCMTTWASSDHSTSD
jgi:hypothetical protein